MSQKHKLSIQEVKEYQLAMLDYIDSLCEENQLTYSLAGGTLLGAIRHGGYIPWDDDIDLIMPRKDYESLLQLIISENSRYQVMDHRYNKEYYYPFAKIVDSFTELNESGFRHINGYGVYIDIFPVDNVPQDKNERTRYVKKMEKMRKRFYKRLFAEFGEVQSVKVVDVRTAIVSCMNSFENLISSIHSCDEWINKILFCASKYRTCETQYAGVIVNGYYKEKEIMEKKVFETVEKRKFENREYYCTKYYNIYLSKLYGDYMQLPPEDKRVSNHDYVAFCIKE